jgi:predicted MFS family arabinose efflux permease
MSLHSRHVGARSLTIAGASLIAVSFGLARYGYGLFVPELRADLNLSTAEVGTVSSLSYVGYGLGLLGCASLVRRRGARAAALTAGSLVTTGIFAVAAARAAPVLAGGMTVAGVGVGLSWPPFSDLAAHHVAPARRGRVMSTISTGTCAGLLVAGPLALLAGRAWRAVWIAFGALALAVLITNALVLPRAGVVVAPARAHRARLDRRLVTLCGYALVYGAIGAAFFTFAVELAHAEHHGRTAAVLVWMIVGATGLGGVLASDLIDRLGLRDATATALAGMTVGLLTVGVFSASLLGLDAGAAVFGPFYMGGAAVIPRWAQRLSPSSPARPHSVATGATALGSVAGALLAGGLATLDGLPAIFVAGAGLTTVTALVVRGLGPPVGDGRAPRNAGRAPRSATEPREPGAGRGTAWRPRRRRR